MLLNLHVKNLALIEEADVDFESGLNILTGETGAGKSIIIGSINIALGGKVTRDMIGGKSDTAIVELVFSVDTEKEQRALQELGISVEEEQVIISRKIMGSRSICKINGETYPVSVVRQAAESLIDIHGQHEHQALLKKKKHLEILDDFAKEELETPKAKLAETYHEFKRLGRELEQFSMNQEERARQIAFLQFEIQEIEAAALVSGEDEELEVRFKKISNSRRITETASEVYSLTGYEQVSGAGETVGRALHLLQGILSYDGELAGLGEQLQDIDGLLNDFNRELSAYMEDIEFAGEEFAQIEERLDLINRLKAKYGQAVSVILEYKEKKEKELAKLEDYEAHRSRLEKERIECEERLIRLSENVSRIRKSQARELAELIREALVDLNFLDVKFDMVFEKTAGYTAVGMDDAGFVISTNPGEPLRPLQQVASGGELSRIMLAVITVLADRAEPECLIFDEIDVGISGRTAQKVSEKLSLAASAKQVICITHLAQIAAMGDTHFLIDKGVQGQKTVTSIKRLSQEESVLELSRILGGAEITEAVEKSAGEMKELADRVKAERQDKIRTKA